MATYTHGSGARFITGAVTIKNNFALGKIAVLEHFSRAIAATGEDIAQTARELMTPGHFLDTGLSQDETRWEQLGTLNGQVHIPTAYAAYPEFGTAHMAPRPVLTPAVMYHWPSTLYRHWAESDLPALKPLGGMTPIGRGDRRTGRGYA